MACTIPDLLSLNCDTSLFGLSKFILTESMILIGGRTLEGGILYDVVTASYAKMTSVSK